MSNLLKQFKVKLFDIFEPTIDKPLQQVLYFGTIIGIYFPKRNERFTNNQLIYILSVIIIIQLLYFSLEMIDAYNARNRLNNFTKNFCLSCTHGAGIIKIMNLLYRRKDVTRTVDLLKFMIKKYAKSVKQKCESVRAEKELTFLAIMFLLLVTLTTLTAITLIIINGPEMIGEHFPFCVYLPKFMPDIIKFIYCGISVLWNAHLIVIHDCLIIGLMIYICSQLEILKLSLRSLEVDLNGKISNVPFLHLHECIKHHQLIIRLTEEVESLFSGTLLLQFFTSLIIFGLTGFQITIEHNSIIVISAYLSCIFVELFIYCWYANQIIEKSNALGMNAYFCSWYNYGCKFTKILTIFIMRAQIPLNLTAGGFFILSLDTFSQILSRSYSYMALLRQLYDDPV